MKSGSNLFNKKSSQNGSTLIVVLVLLLVVLLGLLNLSGTRLQWLKSTDLHSKKMIATEVANVAFTQALSDLNSISDRFSDNGSWYFSRKLTPALISSKLSSSSKTYTSPETSMTAKYIVFRHCDPNASSITDITAQCQGAATGTTGSGSGINGTEMQTKVVGKDQLTATPLTGVGSSADTAYTIVVLVEKGPAFKARYSFGVAP